MSKTLSFLPLVLSVVIVRVVLPVTLMVLAIRALLKYIRSKPIREEQTAAKRSLGETIRAHRTRCQMTQEFVAESLGVTRQAVSKWEQGGLGPQHLQSVSSCKALRRLRRRASRGRGIAPI